MGFRTVVHALHAVSCLTLATASVAHAERLPTRTYTLADGLPSTFVEHITTDSRGLLWLSTRDGLARFDGARFVTYGVEHGLPVPNVSALLESRRGTYWVATNGGGVCLMDPAASRKKDTPGGSVRALFRCTSLGSAAADHVNTLHEDLTGRIYAGTDAGLFRLDGASNVPRFHKMAFDASQPSRPVTTLLTSEDGDLWMGTDDGVLRLREDGTTSTYQPYSAKKTGKVREIARGPDGRIWVAFSHGLLTFRPAGTTAPARRASLGLDNDEWNWFDYSEADMGEQALAVSADGRVWVGTNRGLSEFYAQRFRRYGGAHALPDSLILDVAEDRDGNLWISSLSGLTRLNREGFVTFDASDGLERMPIQTLFEDAGGQVFAAGGNWVMGRYEEGRFVSSRIGPPREQPAWASQLVLLDRHAGWWILAKGLAHVTAIRGVEQLHWRRSSVIYNEGHGLAPAEPYRAFEDAHGDVWIADRGQPGGLSRWERATGRFHRYPDAQGDVPGDSASAFCDAGAAGLWIGFYRGGLLRFRDKRFERIEGADMPRGMITAIRQDAAGRLWIASNQDGVTRVDDPTLPRPHFVRYASAEGLSSNNVRAIAPEPDGHILVGSVRGLDRLHPEKGVVRHYTTADGLASDFVTALLHDRTGRIWVGTLDGLSQLLPAGRPRMTSPPVWIDGLRIGGEPHPVAHLGETSVAGVVLGPNRNQVEIDFYSLDFGPGRFLRYQHRIEGLDDAWSAPSAERTLHYPRLAAGRYQFLVRAVTSDGLVSATPARVEVTVLPPLWQRWWFQSAAVLLVALVSLSGHRYRVRRVVETERLRTRLASDLHDDIGSTLSQIAILSEVTRTVVSDDPRAADPLERIARLSRESVDAMGDIVWAVDPHRDTPVHLAKRMRRLASDLLPPVGITLGFHVADVTDAHLGPDVRREVFLIFKEVLNNIVRHAHATHVDVNLALSPHRLELTVQDDGCGAAPDASGDGHGLWSMRRRAESVGGILDVETRKGRGTRVMLTVPVRRPRGVHRITT